MLYLLYIDGRMISTSLDVVFTQERSQVNVERIMTKEDQRDKDEEKRVRVDTFLTLSLAFIFSTLITYRFSSFIIWVASSVVIVFLLVKLYERGVGFGRKWGDSKKGK